MKIRYDEKRGKKPWCLDVGTFDGKRQREYFKSEAKARAAMAAKIRIQEIGGKQAVVISHAKRLEYMAADAKAQSMDVTVMHCVLAYEARPDLTTKKPLAAAIAECIAAKESAGRREVYTKSLQRSLQLLLKACPGLQVHQLTQGHIEAFARKNAKSLATVRSRLIDVRTLFSYCIKRKWCLQSPAAGIERVQVADRPPGIHTLQEVRILMDKARETDPALIGYLAPIYFGGLRPNESRLLTTGNIHDGLIEVTPDKSKTRRRRFVPINETLKAWLSVPGVKFGISPRTRRVDALRSKLQVDGEPFPWPHDAARHSFCSYALPKYGATKTAEWAGHSEQILFAHYRERVKPDDAEAYWKILP